MAASVNDAHIDETHFHIIRLLNDIDQVDTHIRMLHGGKPIWTQKYNLLCLLNCKEVQIGLYFQLDIIPQFRDGIFVRGHVCCL